MARSSTNYANGGTSNAVHLDGADWRGKSGQTLTTPAVVTDLNDDAVLAL